MWESHMKESLNLGERLSVLQKQRLKCQRVSLPSSNSKQILQAASSPSSFPVPVVSFLPTFNRSRVLFVLLGPWALKSLPSTDTILLLSYLALSCTSEFFYPTAMPNFTFQS